MSFLDLTMPSRDPSAPSDDSSDVPLDAQEGAVQAPVSDDAATSVKSQPVKPAVDDDDDDESFEFDRPNETKTLSLDDVELVEDDLSEEPADAAPEPELKIVRRTTMPPPSPVAPPPSPAPPPAA